MCLANVLGARFGKPEVLHLSRSHQILDGARDVFHRHGRIDPVLVEQIDVIGAQPLQRRIDHVANVPRTAVEADRLVLVVDLEAELGAISTSSRNGWSASPTSSSLTNGP